MYENKIMHKPTFDFKTTKELNLLHVKTKEAAKALDRRGLKN